MARCPHDPSLHPCWLAAGPGASEAAAGYCLVTLPAGEGGAWRGSGGVGQLGGGVGELGGLWECWEGVLGCWEGCRGAGRGVGVLGVGVVTAGRVVALGVWGSWEGCGGAGRGMGVRGGGVGQLGGGVLSLRSVQNERVAARERERQGCAADSTWSQDGRPSWL